MGRPPGCAWKGRSHFYGLNHENADQWRVASLNLSTAVLKHDVRTRRFRRKVSVNSRLQVGFCYFVRNASAPFPRSRLVVRFVFAREWLFWGSMETVLLPV